MSILRHFAGNVYRRLAAPFGVRALDRMLGDGLPPRLERPLRFLFTAERPAGMLALERRIEARRAEIANQSAFYQFSYHSSAIGMVRWPESVAGAQPGSVVSSRRLANHSSVPRRWGTFLHLCAEALDARTILEMGACVGISGAYLASAASHPRFITIEGSAALAAIAEATLSKFSNRAIVIRDSLDSGIPRALTLLAQEQSTIDIAYLDGHHEEAPTLHYVRTLLPHLVRGALIILDDISLHAGMRRAWHQLSTMAGVGAAVDTGRLGLLVWHGGSTVPRQYDLAHYTGVWRSQNYRRGRASVPVSAASG
jgi:predicted O-methyltransferase YrrM